MVGFQIQVSCSSPLTDGDELKLEPAPTLVGAVKACVSPPFTLFELNVTCT